MPTRHHLPPAHDGELLSTADVLRMLRRSRATLYRWVNLGLLPRPRRIQNSSYWSRSELQAAIERAAPGLYSGEATIVRQG